MYRYQSLQDTSYREISKCLNLAFSDYALPVQLSDEQLQMYFHASGVDLSLSFGAFAGNQMVGFILNSTNIYHGQRAVFDAGTGVIPEHREKKVFTNIFRFAEQELKKRHIEKYYLEVLQQNEKAISSYTKQGFTVAREFSVLKAAGCAEKAGNAQVQYRDLPDFDQSKTGHCICVKPSYEHCANVINRNPHLYRVAFIPDKETVSAFSVFAKADGHIVQLGYTNMDDFKLVVKQLLWNYENITVKNIDLIYSDVLESLHSMGFHEVCRQFEMVKTI